MIQEKPNSGNKSGLLKNSKPVFLAFAKIRKPHALKGEVSVEMLADFPEHYQRGAEIFIGDDRVPHTIHSIRKTGKTYLVAFENLNTRDAVEHLRNSIIYVRTKTVPALGVNEFYHHELIGMKVVDISERALGIVTEIITTGANDVYVIDQGIPDSVDILIPAIDSVIKKIEIEKGTIVVELPEWL